VTTKKEVYRVNIENRASKRTWISRGLLDILQRVKKMTTWYHLIYWLSHYLRIKNKYRYLKQIQNNYQFCLLQFWCNVVSPGVALLETLGSRDSPRWCEAQDFAQASFHHHWLSQSQRDPYSQNALHWQLAEQPEPSTNKT